MSTFLPEACTAKTIKNDWAEIVNELMKAVYGLAEENAAPDGLRYTEVLYPIAGSFLQAVSSYP